MNNVFEKIYNDKTWACGTILSGAGSCPIGASDYIEYLKQYSNRNILDLGCGDLSIYNKNIFFKNHIAVDLVDMTKYINIDGIKFIKSDIILFDYYNHDFDLIVMKDVLQHLSNKTVFKIFNVLKQVKCELLITNDFNFDLNQDCLDGEYRSLDICKPPFNIVPINRHKWTSKIDSRTKETIHCNLY